jgi:hypothetical protein
MPYRVVEYDSGPEGMVGMEALINEWAAKGYSLHQVVRESTYRWVLILSQCSAKTPQPIGGDRLIRHRRGRREMKMTATRASSATMAN